MLGTLKEDKKQNWKAHVAPVVHAYNCTRNDATGFSPFFLMFGRHPRLPIDLILGSQTKADHKNYNTFVSDLRKQLSSAYKLAQNFSSRSKLQHKKL